MNIRKVGEDVQEPTM
uniref:Uncharacterized protein n=1 Tax=Anguilla anguilla TaxID=7936 RepID=A0A0E9TLW1_ANGAN